MAKPGGRGVLIGGGDAGPLMIGGAVGGQVAEHTGPLAAIEVEIILVGGHGGALARGGLPLVGFLIGLKK